MSSSSSSSSLFPWHWRFREHAPSYAEIVEAHAEVERVGTSRGDTPNEWEVVYARYDKFSSNPYGMLDPVIRRFFLWLCPDHKERMTSWVEKYGKYVETLTPENPRKIANALIDYQMCSNDVTNGAMSSGAGDFDQLDRMLSKTEPLMEGGSYYGFTPSPREILVALQWLKFVFIESRVAIPLDIGMILLEGRVSKLMPKLEVGLSIVKRARAVSTSKAPGGCLRSSSALYVNCDEEGFKALLNGDEHGILFAHEIVCPKVLGLDLNAARTANAPETRSQFYNSDAEQEILLQPFTKFHIVEDELIVLPRSNVHSNTCSTVLYRLLRTHLWVEGVDCPRCVPSIGKRKKRPDNEDEEEHDRTRLTHLINCHLK